MAKFIHPVFKYTNEKSGKELDLLAQELDQKVFAKTDCLSCANCCKSAPPIVSKKDIKRIAKFLKTTPKQIERQYVIEDFSGEMSFKSIPCQFLDEQNYCTIYEARPSACRDFPHVHSGNFKGRKKLHSTNSLICPAVEEILDLMVKKLSTAK